jgi:hypothetical protein
MNMIKVLCVNIKNCIFIQEKKATKIKKKTDLSILARLLVKNTVYMLGVV